VSGLDEGLRRLYERLVGTGLPVFVGGSVAAMWYGEPRSTLDIDLVVRAGPADAERFVAAFPPPGFYLPPLEVLREELARGSGGHFNVIDLASGLKADVYVAGDDPLIAYGFEEAAPRPYGGLSLTIASATYVVAMKLRYYGISRQDKHLRDIRSLLAISPAAVDMERVAAWARRFGVEAAWEACRRQPGEE
jgi:hypothetical protein